MLLNSQLICFAIHHFLFEHLKTGSAHLSLTSFHKFNSENKALPHYFSFLLLPFCPFFFSGPSKFICSRPRTIIEEKEKERKKKRLAFFFTARCMNIIIRPHYVRRRKSPDASWFAFYTKVKAVIENRTFLMSGANKRLSRDLFSIDTDSLLHLLFAPVSLSPPVVTRGPFFSQRLRSTLSQTIRVDYLRCR